MLKKNIILFILLALFNDVFAQRYNKDSLIEIAENIHSTDSVKYEAYSLLSSITVYSQKDSSYYFATKAFRFAKKLNSRKKQGYVFSLLGNYYFLKESYSKAINNYNEALRLAELTDDYNLKIITLANIASIYATSDKQKIAIEYLENALKIANDKTVTEWLPVLYTNLSDSYLKSNNVKESVKYAQMSVSLFLKNNDPMIYGAYNNLGAAYFKLGKIEEALINYRKSAKILKTQNNIYAEIDLDLNFSKLFEFKKQADSAIYYAKNAELKSEGLMYIEGKLQSYFRLYSLYKTFGNPINALQFHEKYLELLKEQHKEAELAEIEKNIFIYNTNKKIQEDSLKQRVLDLKKDNKIKAHQAQIKQDKFFKIGLGCLILIAICVTYFAYNRYKVILFQHKLIEIKNKQTEEQKAIIIQKNSEVKDSLNYAKRIQEGLLASEKALTKNLKEYFTLFKPKDIVSGDFYWCTEYQNDFYLAVCDSTGHGVPGAFMSLLNIALLSEAIKEKQIKEPHLIFNEVRNRLIEIISADGHKDGFDGILIRLYKKDNKVVLEYASANNEPIVVRNNEIMKLDLDRMPVGKSDFLKSFSLYTIDILDGDILYLYTDGFADQFGGENQKKFKRKHLNELLLENSKLAMEKQIEHLNVQFDLWKGNEEQVDDVCIVGIKF